MDTRQTTQQNLTKTLDTSLFPQILHISVSVNTDANERKGEMATHREALSVTYSSFYVPLIITGIASAGIKPAMSYVERRGRSIVPVGVSGAAWCDWAEAIVRANGWTDRHGGAADVLWRRMAGEWGTPYAPYAVAGVQEAIVDALFGADATLAAEMTAAAIAHMSNRRTF